jgi:hypothetical protein
MRMLSPNPEYIPIFIQGDSKVYTPVRTKEITVHGNAG